MCTIGATYPLCRLSQPIPVFIQPNGIAGVNNGLQYMWDGRMER